MAGFKCTTLAFDWIERLVLHPLIMDYRINLNQDKGRPVNQGEGRPVEFHTCQRQET
jgi:hypothetical protein